MDKIIYFVICILLSLSTTGSSIRCYVCDSNIVDGCVKETRPKNYTCGSKIGYFKQVCVYTVLYNNDRNEHKVHTGCELIYEKDPLSSNKVKSCLDYPSNNQLIECRVCDQDLCNSSNNLNTRNNLLYLFVLYLVADFVLQ